MRVQRARSSASTPHSPLTRYPSRVMGGGTGTTPFPARAMPWLLVLYCAASLLHFVHNAEHVATYPNLPNWISSGSIYFAWCTISAIGTCGYVLLRRRHPRAGLSVLAVYALLGLDGLLHYSRAPISAHTLAMNLTIWTEAVTAALLLGAVLWLATYRLPMRDVRDA